MKKTSNKYLLTLIMTLVGLSSQAQNIAPRDNVLWDFNYFNPSMITKKNGIYVDFYGRYDGNEVKKDYVNPLDIAAETFVVRDRYTWQATLAHDALSYFDATSFDVAYSHRFDFGDEKQHGFRVGARAIVGYGRIDFSKLSYGQHGYQIMVRPDFDLGFDYRYRILHVGLSIKNVLSLPIKYEDMVYFRYPRAGLAHVLVDVVVNKNCIFTPYALFGLSQNFYMDVGLGATIWKNYHLSYNFHGPDFAHNVGVAFDIAKMVRLEGGVRLCPAHSNYAGTLKISVRLAD